MISVSYVSGRATRLLLESAELRGIEPRSLVAGMTLSLDELRDVRARIPWSAFVDLIDNLERAVGGLPGLEKLGAAMAGAPSYNFFHTAARYVVTTRQLHELGRRFVAPALFPDLPIELLESTDQRLVLRCRLPPGWRSCPGFFHLCRGSLSMLSTLLGLPPSIVDGSIGARSATIEIIMPRDERRGRSLVRRIRARIAGVPINEILAHQDEVNENYERLLRTRQEFRDLLEHAPMGAALHRQGRYVWANAALARMLGWERPADLVGRALLDDVHPDDRDEAARKLAAEAGDAQTGKVRVLRRDGTTGIYHVSATQDVTFQGESARLIVGNDITERARVREQLALADRMAAVGMLAAGVAHEINNPLTYVHLNVEAIARGLARADTLPALQTAASTAMEGMERVRAIVADLRTFARVDEDTVGPVDVNDVVSTTLRLAAKTIGASATLDVELGDVPPVHGNRGRLGQVVLNLLLNAHEACEERGSDGVIRVRSTRDEDRVQLEVADSGIGMKPEALRRAFEPFYTTKPTGRGTGLGLPICHRIITRFGGEITIESNPTRDGARELRTVVRIVLPAADTASANGRIDTPPRNTPTPRRILVIDDEASVCDAIASVLGADHAVEIATSGATAIERLRADVFDLILCDVMMPGVDGIAVYEEVEKAAPALAKRFVFMSGGAFTPRARAFLASCPNKRFEKPFNADQLIALTERALR
jgi:PAS domain S-box-containing protein